LIDTGKYTQAQCGMRAESCTLVRLDGRMFGRINFIRP